MAEAQTPVTQTEVGQPTGGDAPFPPFNTATFPSQLFWFAIVFIALYMIMSRTALPRVEGILKNRRSHISNDIASAAAMQKQADEAGALYEKTLAEAKAGARTTAQETSARLAAESQAKRKRLEDDLSTKLAAAEAEISATKANAMSNVETIAHEAAAAIVKHITGWTADAEEITNAVAAARLAERGQA